MSIQPLWLTHFIEILLLLEFQFTKFIVVAFSYMTHFRPQNFSNGGAISVEEIVAIIPITRRKTWESFP